MLKSKRSAYMLFVLGISLGFLISTAFHELQTALSMTCDHHVDSLDSLLETNYAIHLNEEFDEKQLPSPTHKDKLHGPILFHDLDSVHHKSRDKVARLLSKKVRVLCWIMTDLYISLDMQSNMNHFTKGQGQSGYTH